MKYIDFNGSGAIVARYDSEIHTFGVPASSIEVSDELFFQTISETDGVWKRDPATGDIAKHPFPPPTPAEIEAAKVATVQLHMDKAARAYRYDNITTAITYAEEPAVPKFQAEGQAFRAWRSLVWAKCYAILDEVNDGLRGIPTDEELISELPALVLPE